MAIEAKTEADTSGDEMVPWDEPEGATGLARIEPTAELLEKARRAILDDEAPPEIGDPNITARLITQRILDGTLEDSMRAAEKLDAWQDVALDRQVVVRGFHLNPSSFETEHEDGRTTKGVYAVVEIADGTGAIQPVTVGGKNVLAQLVKAWEEGAFPFVAVLTAVSTSTAGRKTLYLKRPQ